MCLIIVSTVCINVGLESIAGGYIEGTETISVVYHGLDCLYQHRLSECLRELLETTESDGLSYHALGGVHANTVLESIEGSRRKLQKASPYRTISLEAACGHS